MTSQKKSFRLIGYIVLACLTVGLFIFVITPQVQASRAETILKNASTHPIPHNLQGKHVVHAQSLMQMRMDPNQIEPQDPYHRAILDHYSGTTETDQWLLVQNQRVIQSRITERDTNSKLILFDWVYDGERDILYDSHTEYAFILPRSKTPAPVGGQPVPFPEFIRSQGLKLSTIPNSTWGEPAWLVQHQEKNISQDKLSQLSNPSASSPARRPSLAGLDIIEFSTTWVVDQSTEQLISFEWQAITPQGEVLLQRIERRVPEILTEATLPADWLDFPKERPVFKTVPPSDASQSDIIKNLDEAVAAADFQVHLPDIPKESDLVKINVSFKTEVEPNDVWRREWVFDIQDAASHGLALEVIYHPEIDEQSVDVSSALAVIQGPSTRLVPLMRETKPVWTQSHPVQLILEGQTITAWVAEGGVLNNPPAQIAVMLELNDTFLFIVGQGYTKTQVLEIVGTIRPVN